MKALVVDDDRVIADLVVFTLRRAGFEALIANDVASAVRRWQEDQPDLIILDINLPGTPGLENGFAICKRIRSEANTPIILLTVRAEEQDIVRGLEAGADDYVLKPFSPRQLMARVQAVMRRFQATNFSQPASLSAKGLDFHPKLREIIFSDGSTKSLTQLESRLLEALMIHAGQVLTTDDLISDVWGSGGGSHEMLRQLVKRLRVKVEAEPTNPLYIHNVPGLGYTFRLRK